MKTNWTYILSALIIGTLSLSACGKKGGGSTATPPTGGNDQNPPPGQQQNTGRGSWTGHLNFNGSEGRRLLMKLLKKSGYCYSNKSCRFMGAQITLRLIDGTQPGRGQIRIQTYGGSYWLHDLNKYAQALPESNGFQITYNVNGGGWTGGHVWNWHGGGKHCYWKQTYQPSQQDRFLIGGYVNIGGVQLGGQFQQGYGMNQAQYVCEDVTSMYEMTMSQGDDGMFAQQSLNPQVIDPNQAQAMSAPQNFWIGHQVQAVAQFKDSTKTCILIKLYYMGQLIGEAEAPGTVY